MIEVKINHSVSKMMPIHPMEMASIDIINDYWDELLKDQGMRYSGSQIRAGNSKPNGIIIGTMVYSFLVQYY